MNLPISFKEAEERVKQAGVRITPAGLRYIARLHGFRHKAPDGHHDTYDLDKIKEWIDFRVNGRTIASIRDELDLTYNHIHHVITKHQIQTKHWFNTLIIASESEYQRLESLLNSEGNSHE